MSPKSPYSSRPSYDPESNLPRSATYRLLRRLAGVSVRHAKWFALGSILLAAYLLLNVDHRAHRLYRPPWVPPPHDHGPPGGAYGSGPPHLDVDSDGWGFDDDSGPPPPEVEVGDEAQHRFIVDEDGDHFHYAWKQDNIPPLHPDMSELPPPSTLFPEVDENWLHPPKLTPYPDERLAEIISSTVPPEPDESREPAKIPADAFSSTWKLSGASTTRGEVRRVQWTGFAGGRDRWETDRQREERKERKEAVRRGFEWAWQGYKSYAWGHDEVKPISKLPSNPFNGWGASIVDTLDTLLLMGLSKEYNLCRAHVNQLNFHWLGGKDWSRGYTGVRKTDDEEGETEETFSMSRDRTTNLAVFETGIRYLGGLLGAYDLSGDDLLLTRALDLGDVLARAFRTESGLPSGRIDPGTKDYYHLYTVSTAEIGSMTLELTRLSQASGNNTFYELAQRGMDYLEQRVIPRSKHEPLMPQWFQVHSPLETPMDGSFTFGGLVDSYYEYLIKQYKLLGASEAAQQYRRVYEASMDKAREKLFLEIGIVPQRKLMAIGKIEGGRIVPEIEHLTSFAGAMLGLGSRLLDRDADLRDALTFTETCYWLSAATATGLQPEAVEFYDSDWMAYENLTIPDMLPLHRRVDFDRIREQDGFMPEGIHKDRGGRLRYNGDGAIVMPEDGGHEDAPGPREYIRRLKGSPAGAKRVQTRGINRPENIESIFYMFRLTGDRKWQEKGWKMFVSWATAAKVTAGMSSINDVTSPRFTYGDNMESFTFAETFKYHYLLQSEPELMSLDDYVLNTEAHPFLANPDLQPGSSRLWTPDPSVTSTSLGHPGEGTDAQKWLRFEYLDKTLNPPVLRPVAIPQGGGKGMGGGGGDPDFRPKPPMMPGFGAAAGGQAGGRPAAVVGRPPSVVKESQ